MRRTSLFIVAAALCLALVARHVALTQLDGDAAFVSGNSPVTSEHVGLVADSVHAIAGASSHGVRLRISRRAREIAEPEAPPEEVIAPLDVPWLECDLRFLAEERKIAKIEAAKKSMAEAAENMDFEKAQALKMFVKRATAEGVPEPPAPEQWLLREAEFAAFSKFLQLRGLGPMDVEIKCYDNANALSEWASRKCTDCIKHNAGGPYGTVGVTSPAYPVQTEASGCLSQSKYLKLEYQEDAGEDASVDTSADPTSSAFCQVK